MNGMFEMVVAGAQGHQILLNSYYYLHPSVDRFAAAASGVRGQLCHCPSLAFRRRVNTVECSDNPASSEHDHESKTGSLFIQPFPLDSSHFPIPASNLECSVAGPH
jgi:hypothetical protein